ncbi:MAG: dTDP-4-dehydrorhamnose reductase [Clostridiales Family XIII bacterium]|jgi:dTDP-4-dehydrorhamnose reductase|nr:dTDP-4-dehydrorhamnose reductase [Clostridiales Family XIII bacterium]
MKILITGSNGQLGNELADILSTGKGEIGAIDPAYQGAAVTSIDVAELDITNGKAVTEYVKSENFDLIINCAAMTNVDACETNFETALRVNALGARNLAVAANETASKFVHISTDYIFGGDADIPYAEWDTPAPATVYGKSKLLGERYVSEACSRAFIFRTSWLYGYVGNNFVKTIIGLAQKNEHIKVVYDQVGNPTHANDLAYHILKVALTDVYGFYHCTGSGICSWHEFATEIVRLTGLSCIVDPCTTDEFPRPAPRPAYSAMDNLMLRSTVGDEMRDWKDALKHFMDKFYSDAANAS